MSSEPDVAEAVGFLPSAPMRFDCIQGWDYFSQRGDVFEADGTWYFTSYETVRFAHRDPQIFSTARAYNVGTPLPLVPIGIDPPDHRRYRKVLDPMFSPREIARIEPELRRQVVEIIDGFADTGSCEIVGDLAIPFPGQVFMTMAGLPLQDHMKFLNWVNRIMEGVECSNPTHDQVVAGEELLAYLQHFIDEKRRTPEDDLISAILGSVEENSWTDPDILSLCLGLIVAGLDTVTAGIGFTMLHLAANPELRRRVVEDPELAPQAIEEILRLEMAAPLSARVTTEDIELSGHRIPAQSNIILVLATANRDPVLGSELAELNPDRENHSHLSFGGGIHRCFGSHLARCELRLVVEEFHRRIPDYRIPDGYRPEIVWPSLTFHLKELPLEFPSVSSES